MSGQLTCDGGVIDAFERAPSLSRAETKASLAWLKDCGLTNQEIRTVASSISNTSPEGLELLKTQFVMNTVWLQPRGVGAKAFAQAALRNLDLFSVGRDSLEMTFNENASYFETFGIPSAKWAKAASEEPLLFTFGSRDVIDKAQSFLARAAAYHIPDRVMAEALVAHPSLLFEDLHKIDAGVVQNAAWFERRGITSEAWIRAGLSHPKLLTIAPETIKANDTRNGAWLNARGVDEAQWTAAALAHPMLWTHDPDAMHGWIESVHAGLKDENVSVKDMACAVFRHPQLLSHDPDFVRKTFEKNRDALGPQGVSGSAWATAALKHPPLFYLPPREICTTFRLLQAIGHRLMPSSTEKDASRETWILERPHLFTMSQRNILLRLAAAELVSLRARAHMPHKTVEDLLLCPRKDVEKVVGSILFPKGDSAIRAIFDGMDAKREVSLDYTVREYAESLVKNVSRKSRAERGGVAISILSVLMAPEEMGGLRQLRISKDAAALLFERMVKAKLIRPVAPKHPTKAGYRL